MNKNILSITLLALLIISILVISKAGVQQAKSISHDIDTRPKATAVVRVYYNQPEQIRLLNEFDLFEYNNLAEQYVLVAVNESEISTLQTLGFRVIVDVEETAVFNRKPPTNLSQASGIPGYPCYRTVAETYATAVDISNNYPNLATWIDIGDSWEKSQAPNTGHDLRVLKLTNDEIPGPKPKIFIMSSVHAREYTPAELNTRFAEMLVNNYKNNADIHWLLDYHEIHLLLQANPDGRIQAENGILWRKNTNDNYCSPQSVDRGADLNRNFSFQWNCCNGSSSSQCQNTYHGPFPASEPEVQAIQNYVRNTFPDQRGDALTDPAPNDATGVFLDLHSFSQLLLWPWGWGPEIAPNGPALQTFGRKMAYFNNYFPDQAIGLYPTDGTTDDFAYGELGLAAYTFELGSAFFQSCAVFENNILPNNMPALLYAAKAARAPYLLPAGPEVMELPNISIINRNNIPITIIATIDDTRFNQNNGNEAVQNIAAAEIYIDVPDWDIANNPQPIAMSAGDGAFDSPQETAVATLEISELSEGRHILYVRGQDSAGNWGVTTAAYLTIGANIGPQHISILPIIAR